MRRALARITPLAALAVLMLGCCGPSSRLSPRGGASFGDAELGRIVGLRSSRTELYLTGTGVTDVGLIHLEGLTDLRELYLSDTAVTDAGLVHLEGLTSLQHLSLSDTAVTDAGRTGPLEPPGEGGLLAGESDGDG